MDDPAVYSFLHEQRANAGWQIICKVLDNQAALGGVHFFEDGDGHCWNDFQLINLCEWINL